MRKQLIKTITFLVVSAAFSITAYAQQASRTIEVKFLRGKFSRTYKDTISHSSNTYYLKAKRGQTLIVKISDPGNETARFHIGMVPPGDRSSKNWKMISSADLKSYTYKITTDDEIVIPVGAVRGSTAYALTITIK